MDHLRPDWNKKRDTLERMSNEVAGIPLKGDVTK